MVIVLDEELRGLSSVDGRFNDRVTEIKYLMEHGHIYPALTMALVLPDICASYHLTNSEKRRESGQRYISWINKQGGDRLTTPLPTNVTKNVDDYFSLGNIIYQLRCSFVHSLSDAIGFSEDVLLDLGEIEKRIRNDNDIIDKYKDNAIKKAKNKRCSAILLFDAIADSKKVHSDIDVDPRFDIRNFDSVFVEIGLTSLYWGKYGLTSHTDASFGPSERHHSLEMKVDLGATDLVTQVCDVSLEFYNGLSIDDKQVIDNTMVSFVEQHAYDTAFFEKYY